MNPRHILAVCTALSLAGLAYFALDPSGAGAPEPVGTRSGGQSTPSRSASAADLAGPPRAIDRGGEAASDAARVAAETGASPASRAARGPVPQLVGRAVSDDGDPLAGAIVRATTRRSSVPLGLERDVFPRPEALEELGPPEDERGVIDVVAEEDGAFEVGPAGVAEELRPGRRLELLVRAPGFIPARPAEEPMSVDLPHDAGDVVLRPGLRAEGRVTGPDGRPVAGARLAFGQPDLSGLVAEAVPTRGLQFAVTGEDGAFACTELRAGRFWIIAAKDGMTAASYEGTIRPGERLRGVDLRLSDATTIAGVVRGMPEGLSAVVVAAPADDDQQREVSDIERRWRELPIDADGAFGEALFASGVKYRLRVATVDGASGERDLTRAVDQVVAPAPSDDVELVWDARTSVIGRVVAMSGTGEPEPVEAFMVAYADGAPEGDDFDARTLEEGDSAKREFPGGRFRFADLDGGRGRGRGGDEARTMTFRVRAVGYRDLFVRGVEVARGETTDLGDLTVSPGETIAVRVVEEGEYGRTISGARVFACASDNDRWFQRWRGRDEPAWTSDTVRFGETGENGLAMLQMPPGGGAIKIAVNADGYAFSEPIEVPRTTQGPIEVRLAPGATVVATLTTPSGKPAPGVDVQLIAREREVRGPRRQTARTDDTGVATFMAVPAGRHVVRADLPEMRPRRPEGWSDQQADVQVPEAGEVAVRLRVLATSGVTGRVVEAGAPLPDARIEFAIRSGDRLTRPDWRAQGLRAITDADGFFAVEGVPVGEYEVGVAHRDRSMTTRFEVTITEDTAPLFLSLPEAIIAGTVVDARSGDAVRGVELRISDLRDEDTTYIGEQTLREEPDGDLDRDGDWSDPGRFRTGRGGAFRFRGVGVGEPIRIRISGQYVQSRTHRVEPLAPGETREDLVVQVQAAGALEVEARTADGGRWRGRTRFELQRLARDGQPRGRPDVQTERWRARYQGIAPGKYRLTVMDGRNQETSVTQEVEVRANRSDRVQVTLE